MLLTDKYFGPGGDRAYTPLSDLGARAPLLYLQGCPGEEAGLCLTCGEQAALSKGQCILPSAPLQGAPQIGIRLWGVTVTF